VRAAIVVALAVIATRTVVAQAPARATTLDVRIDGIVNPDAASTHFGLGIARPMTRNVGAQLVLGAGATLTDDDDRHGSGRADLLVRFAPAPSSGNAWAAYANAGVGALVQRESKGRAVLVVLIGLQKRRGFLEAGLGGGVRVGAGLRF
jgi:hypothetical protein